MRRMVPGRPHAVGAALALAVLAAALVPAVAGPKPTRKKPRPLKIQETVGDLAYVVSNGEMMVEGVGLVIGLDHTGKDSPPSQYRKILLDEMSKAGVEHAERLLASPQVSIVVVPCPCASLMPLPLHPWLWVIFTISPARSRGLPCQRANMRTGLRERAGLLRVFEGAEEGVGKRDRSLVFLCQSPYQFVSGIHVGDYHATPLPESTQSEKA